MELAAGEVGGLPEPQPKAGRVLCLNEDCEIFIDQYKLAIVLIGRGSRWSLQVRKIFWYIVLLYEIQVSSHSELEHWSKYLVFYGAQHVQ